MQPEQIGQPMMKTAIDKLLQTRSEYCFLLPAFLPVQKKKSTMPCYRE